MKKKKKSVQILIISENFNKMMVIIKKKFNKLFSDLKLTIECLINDSCNKIVILNIFKTINFKLNSFKKTNINKNFQINEIFKKVCSKKESIKFKIYLKALNSYGEIIKEKNYSLNSSAVEHRTENP